MGNYYQLQGGLGWGSWGGAISTVGKIAQQAAAAASGGSTSKTVNCPPGYTKHPNMDSCVGAGGGNYQPDDAWKQYQSKKPDCGTSDSLIGSGTSADPWKCVALKPGPPPMPDKKTYTTCPPGQTSKTTKKGLYCSRPGKSPRSVADAWKFYVPGADVPPPKPGPPQMPPDDGMVDDSSSVPPPGVDLNQAGFSMPGGNMGILVVAAAIGAFFLLRRK